MEKQTGSYSCGGKGPWIAGRIGRGIVIGLAFALAFGFAVQLLWNWLAPGVFGRPEIGYWQAVGIVVLARILFGHRGMRPGFGGKWHGHGDWGGPCSPCSGEDTANGQIRDWRKYDAWWNEEGREAYKKYIDSRQE
jgi:hypothetical protein